MEIINNDIIISTKSISKSFSGIEMLDSFFVCSSNCQKIFLDNIINRFIRILSFSPQ